VHAAVARDAIRRFVVAGEASLVGAFASARHVDLGLVAAVVDVCRAIAVARFADRVRNLALRFDLLRVWVRGERFALIGMAIGAGCRRLLIGGFRRRRWLIRRRFRRRRLLLAGGDDRSERDQEREESSHNRLLFETAVIVRAPWRRPNLFQCRGTWRRLHSNS